MTDDTANVDEELASARDQIEVNSDGTTIVKLRRPVKIEGREYHRLTVPSFKAKHLRSVRFRDLEAGDMGALLDIAESLCSPKGVVGEIEDGQDFNAVTLAVMEQVGKFQGTSAPSSASSGGTSTSPPPS